MSNFGLEPMKQKHRPMFPEYTTKHPSLRTLLLLEKGTLYNARGHAVLRGSSPEELISYLKAESSCAVTQSVTAFHNLDLVVDLARQRVKVLANRKGEPNLLRIPGSKEGTRWIVESENWGVREASPGGVRYISDFIDWYGVGFKPTPGSLGRELMRLTWQRERLKKHTSPGLACEDFLRKNASGGIVQTPGKGTKYDELLMLDMGSAWLSRYVLHPTGTAIPFQDGCDYLEEFFTYFAKCTVYVKEVLPLGPFPKRTGKFEGKRVTYPTEPGVYKDIFLWREQVSDCRRAGCLVQVHNGYGWREYTTDNFYWAKDSYDKRILAERDSGDFAGLCKRVITAAVGGHARPRDSYYLTLEGSYEQGDEPVIVGDECTDLWLRKEFNSSAALMVHWYYYTIAMCNSHVYQFALPFAKEGRLVQIDYDSVLIIEKDERHQYIKREYAKHFDLPPGTWLWMLLHNVHDIKDRSFRSDELSKTPGEPSLA